MENECIICLEDLNDNIAILSCNHKYHYECIQKWMNTKNNFKNFCSICDKDVEIINIVNVKEYKPFRTESKLNLFSCCTII